MVAGLLQHAIYLTPNFWVMDHGFPAALVALIFGLFDFSGGGAADASRAALWLGACFAGLALVVGSFRMRLQR